MEKWQEGLLILLSRKVLDAAWINLIIKPDNFEKASEGQKITYNLATLLG